MSPLRSGLAGRTDGPQRSISSASALLNAAETGWYAGVRDLPVGPLTRNELSAKIEAGDITSESLVWREGLDDWRPLRTVAELSDLVRHAAQRMSDGLLGNMGRREPPVSSSAKVVPIAQGRPIGRAEPPSSADDEGFNDDEPTRMTSLADLVSKAETGHSRVAPESMRPSAPPAEPARPAVAAPPVAPPPTSAAAFAMHASGTATGGPLSPAARAAAAAATPFVMAPPASAKSGTDSPAAPKPAARYVLGPLEGPPSSVSVPPEHAGSRKRAGAPSAWGS